MVKVFNFSIALALAFALANASCSIQSGVDFVGNDIANKPAAKAEECCAKCQATQGCGAFTWTTFNGGTCWLKSSKGASKPNPDAFSAELTVDTCETEKDVDYVGNDVGNAAGKPEECCAKCQQKQGCAAYTWTDFQSGTCWLKSGRGETKANQGAISGVVGSLPTTAPPTPDTIGKTVADHMIKTWPVNIIASDTTCGTKCFSLDYGQVPAKSKPKGWEYTYGVAMDGLWKLYEKTGDKKYFDYVKGYVDTYAFNTTTNRLKLSLSQDSMQPMVLLPGVYNVTKDARYLEAMADARGGIDAYPRNPSGAIWHKPANSDQQWLDGLYMSQPFLAEYAAKYADQIKQGDAATAFDIVTEQFLLAHEHLWDPVKKLHYHAWLQSADMFWKGLSKYTPFIGQKRSEFFWGRSIGWYFVSLMDVLEFLPQNHKDRAKMEEIAGLLAEGIAAQQDDATGLWYQVLDVRNPPNINGGYVNETGITPIDNWLETSSSALFTFGFNKGMRLGVLPCQYRAVAKKGWEGVKTKVVKSGSDVIVKGTIAGMGVGATFNSYTNADFRTDLTSGPAPAPMDLCGPSVPQPMFQSIPKACKFVYVRDNVPQGIGAVILASIEMEYSQDEVDAACKNDHQKCTLVKDVDYAGNDIGNAPASKAEDCCAQCQNKKGCAAFTWTSYNQGTCWFKSSKGKGGVPSTGTISGSVAKNPNQQQ